MTAEVIALTDEVRATNAMLGQVLERLDRADQRQAELARDAIELAAATRKVARATRRHRIGSWVLAGVVAAVTVLGVLFWQNEVNERYRTCVRSNEIRADIRQSIVQSVELLVNEISRDPEAMAPVVKRLEANLVETLPDRVCE